MTFLEHFSRLLVRRPLPALAALYWHLTRRRVRARNVLLAASADLPFAYKLWVSRVENSPQLVLQGDAAVSRLEWRPRFAVALYGSSDVAESELERSRRSVDRQIYGVSALVDAPGHSLRHAIEASQGDYIVLLRAGDLLAEGALLRFAEALNQKRTAAIIYGDQDHLDGRGRRTRPWFKPDWNEEMFLANDYLAAGVAIKARLAKTLALQPDEGDDDLSSLMLRATAEAGDQIIHVPHIVVHVRNGTGTPPDRVAAVVRLLADRGAYCGPGPFNTVKVAWPLPAQLPLVSIIVPTKDKLELLAPCIESVLERTTYDKFEILVVDNGSVEPRTIEYLARIAEHPKVRVLNYARAYNFSAINNFAVRRARGTYLCLLNNDTEVLEREWLTELMRYASRPIVGAVGAKLLYEDGSIQHAGVVVGIGEAAGHAHRFQPSDQPGYFRQAHVAQFVSAVTAACLLVEKRKFEAVGGLDEEHLAIAFNDVDLCLKLEKAGWRNVYVPHAVLLHHESKSRGKDISPQNIDRYRSELKVLQDRWGTRTYADPLHNPNLDRYNETFVFRL